MVQTRVAVLKLRYSRSAGTGSGVMGGGAGCEGGVGVTGVVVFVVTIL